MPRNARTPSLSSSSSAEDDDIKQASLAIRKHFGTGDPLIVEMGSEGVAEASSDGLIYSDPIIGTPNTKRRIIYQKAQVKRLKTMTAKKTRREAENKQRVEKQRKEKERAKERERLERERREEERREYFEGTLIAMSNHGYKLCDFVHHAFDPLHSDVGDWRWNGFFRNHKTVTEILDLWASAHASNSARQLMNKWAAEHVAMVLHKEADTITRKKLVSTRNCVVNREFLLSFSLDGIRESLQAMAPTMFALVESFSVSTRQKDKNKLTERRRIQKHRLETTSVLTLLHSYSQQNNLANSVASIYLAATGAQRQHFAVLRSFGLTLDYTSVVQKPLAKGSLDGSSGGESNKKARRPGILLELSEACREETRKLAASGIFGICYDNINVNNRVAEQILGRKNTQENGTCATLFELYDTSLDNLQVSVLEESYKKANPLRLTDVLLSRDENRMLRDMMVHTILRIIVKYGGPGFDKWKKSVEDTIPITKEKIQLHKTKIYPMPAMEIDESSITGNIEVLNAIYNELGLYSAVNEPIPSTVTIVAGDQLTISRQRAVTNVRLGHECGLQSWRHIVLMPGLFHVKMADCTGMMETYFGKPHCGSRNPTSLSFHNTVLDRLPIILTSLPTFRTCRDLIFISLYARVLHCLLLVSGHQSLEALCTANPSWDQIKQFAELILDKYANPKVVGDMRAERQGDMDHTSVKSSGRRDDCRRKQTGANPKSQSRSPAVAGDMVFENAILFLRDALLSREFTDAIKSGDSGRIIIILKIWALSFRANGRNKYAHEMLHLIHNLVTVWPESIRDVILKNWLVNPTGHPNSWVEVDLMQEHLNFWIKKVYKADGHAHSWEWLGMVSPCIDALRQLADHFHDMLGSRQGKKHTAPDVYRDIERLMARLHQHRVYTYQKGREIDEDDACVVDLISVGLSKLTHGTSCSPFKEYNETFKASQKRHNQLSLQELAASSSHTSHTPDSKDPEWFVGRELEVCMDSQDLEEDQNGTDYDEEESREIWVGVGEDDVALASTDSGSITDTESDSSSDLD